MSSASTSFSRRVLVSQLAVVVITLTLLTAVFGWMSYRNVSDVSETEALSIARTLATTTEVREATTRASADSSSQPAASVTTPLRDITEELRARTGIQFAVITDNRGIRLAHPNAARIGERVSSSPDAALAGHETVERGTGTLGETVRAKVPVFSSADSSTVVGEVSVGIRASVFDTDLRRELLAVGAVAVVALGIGVLASFLLGRRLRRETLGVGPAELADMAREQSAVLRGVDDGVLGFDAQGRVTLSNSAAVTLLDGVPGSPGEQGEESDAPGRPHGQWAAADQAVPAGHSDSDGRDGSGENGDASEHSSTSEHSTTGEHGEWDELKEPESPGGSRAQESPADPRTVTPRAASNEVIGLTHPVPNIPEQVRAMMLQAPEVGVLRSRVNLGDRILLASAMRVNHGGVAVGGVVTLRDETQMLTMASQLQSVTAMADALRTQRHEFANRLHTVLGLIDTEAYEQARTYLASILQFGPIAVPVPGVESVADPYLRALLEAKGTTAAEAGVELLVTPDSLALGQLIAPADITLILGNLVDNAVRAAVRGRGVQTDSDAPNVPDLVSAQGSASTPTVAVQILGVGADLHVTVSDTGDGVPDGLADAIFDHGVSLSDSQAREPRAHGSPAREAQAHSHGIGLAVSRRTARRLGGDLWLIDGRDETLGGAVFGLRVPGVIRGEGEQMNSDERTER